MARPTYPLAALLCVCCFGASLNAQLTRPVPSAGGGGPREVTGVELSEVTTFGNQEFVPYALLPYGDGFVVHAVTEFATTSLLPARQGLDDLRSLQLHRFDADLRRVGAPLPVAWPDEQRDHLGLASLGDALLWTFATYTAKEGVYEVVAEVLNGDGELVAAHPLMKVDRREFGTLADHDARSDDGHYYVRVYADESEQRLLSKRDEERATLTVAVFDNAGALVSKLRRRIPVARDQLEIREVAVDEEGRAYVLAKAYTNSRRRETVGGSDSEVLLFTLAPGAEEFERVNLRLAGQYIEGISMVPGRDGVPAIVGVYSDRIGRRIAGYFATDDPRAGELLTPVPFPQEVLGSLGRRVTDRRRGAAVLEGQFEFRDALRLTDGRLAILLESFRVVTSNNGPVGVGVGAGVAGYQDTDYLFGEGIALTFDAAGALVEALVVPKYQRADAPNNPYYSASLVEYDGAPAVIYNDNPANFTRDADRNQRPLRIQRALAVLAYADAEGRLQREPLFARAEADKLVLVPRSAARLANGDVVFLALRYRGFAKNEVRFGVLRGG